MDESNALKNTGEQAFQSLYRRYRPQRFSELRGQEHVVLALRNAVRDGHVAHAYLFSGPRGTGKTSTARILAKALNCTAVTDGEPCGRCDACLAIAAGTSFDVHELDAASNNGVEAMRDLVARAALATPGSWKVYIVDEVHMLSTAASNALLKTLEEPPSHVVFVLATTDPQKVLPTIRSRTQHFEFHLIAEDALQALLEDVSQAARLTIPEGTIAATLRRAKGSARDALSMLDRIAAAGVIDDDGDVLTRLLGALATNDTSGLLVVLDEALRQGRDTQQLTIELIDMLRLGFLVLVGPTSLTTSSPLSTDELEAIRVMGTARCVRTMELLGTAIVAMRDAPDPRVTLEVALVRAGHPEMENSFEALIERIERLEARLSTLEAADHASSMAKSANLHEEPHVRSTAVPITETASLGTAVNREDTKREPAAGPSSRTPQSGKPALGAYRQSVESASRAGGDSTRDDESAAATPLVTEKLPAAPDASPTRAFPTREELVIAWGDHLLMQLRPKVKAIYLVGRFVGIENGFALLALPNEAHRRVADPLCGEVAEALSTYFSTPIKVRLVIDDPTVAPDRHGDGERRTAATTETDASVASETTETSAPSTLPPEPPSDGAQLDELAELDEDHERFEGEGQAEEGLGLAWAENRILQAFPGAEEL